MISRYFLGEKKNQKPLYKLLESTSKIFEWNSGFKNTLIMKKGYRETTEECQIRKESEHWLKKQQQIPENIGSGHHQASKNERKSKKNRKLLETK